MSAPGSPQKRSKSGQLALVVAIVAGGIHAWAGWSEGHRFAFHVVGHESLFAAAAWLITLIIGAISLVMSRGRAALAIIAVLIAIIGLLGLLTA